MAYRPPSSGVVRKKLDYGRPGDKPGSLTSESSALADFVSLAGGEADTGYTVGRGSPSAMDRSIIATIAGCAFLLGSFAALVICLNCLWSGVFGELGWEKALAGFAGSVLVTWVCAWAGWRFLFKT